MSKQSSASCVPLEELEPGGRPAPGVGLFEAQGLDWVERGCAVGRIKPKPDADRRADDQAGDCPTIGKDQVGLRPGGERISTQDAKDDPQNSASLGNEHRFGQELLEDIAAFGAD